MDLSEPIQVRLISQAEKKDNFRKNKKNRFINSLIKEKKKATLLFIRRSMQQAPKQPMFRHSNLSATSTGSAKRLSSNNPFRSALLQEEATISKDPKYKDWMDQRIDEESVSDSNSFSEGDELIDFTSERVPKKPSLDSRVSDPMT